MKTCARACASLAVVAALALAGCSGSPASEPSPAQPSTAPSGPATTASGGATPTGTQSPTDGSTPSTSPTTDQPVPKATRNGQSAQPTLSAKPAPVDKPVRYSDGLKLRIRSIAFAKEQEKGPGSFPGRQYAVLTLDVENGSAKSLSMDTVVITVLDAKGNEVAPVYTAEAKVQDFAGRLKPGAEARARYAFAVPRSSRSKVTVVVDFDGAHTSAVFRGSLG